LIKNLFDFLVSFVGLILLSPILLITSLISLLVQGAPVLFFHERLGKNETSFVMVKFRTMTIGHSISAEHDITRLTNWGRILRKTSIDELPVLFNVLRGQMSLVGPRPLPIKYRSRFNSFQKKRMNIKPGITGLAQIHGRNHLSWDDRFKYDVEYIQKQSFFFDLVIIFKTLLLVLSGKNVSGEKQEIMPEFLGENNNKIENTNKPK